MATLAAGAPAALAADNTISSADLVKEQTLTVTADADISAKTLKAIPLATYSSATTDGSTITGFDLADAGNATAVDAALKAASIDTTQSTGEAYDAENPMPWVATNLTDSSSSPWAGKLRDFLTQLATQTLTGGTTMTPSADDTKVQTASVTPGIYAILDTTTSGSASIPMMQGTGINGITTLKDSDETLGTVEWKIQDTPTIDKVIVDGSKETDTSVNAIGDTINFRATTKVPNWTGYAEYQLIMNDTLSTGLTFDSVTKVTVDGKTLDTADYKVSTPGSDGKWTVTFAPDSNGTSNLIAKKDTFPVDAPIIVEYSAILNGNAVIGGQGNPNTVTLTYSNNPNDTTSTDTTPQDTTITYTSELDLTKTDMQGTAITGATFRMGEGDTTPGTDADDADSLTFVKTGDGQYRLSTTGDADTTRDLTVASDGTLKITGLNGDYVIRETVSPYGSSFLPTFKANVTATPPTSTGGDATLTATLREADSNNLTSLDGTTFTVKNARNLLDMPKTGATWLTIFGVTAILCLAGGTLLLVRRRA